MTHAGHVLHVSQPTEQGVAIVVADYVPMLIERGWRVTVACPEDGSLQDRCRDLGAEVVTWNAGRSPGPAVRAETKDLKQVIAAAQPDLIHLHSSKAGLAGRLAIRGQVPTLFSPHAWSFLHGGKATRRAALAWERYAQRWTNLYVCGSTDERATGRYYGITGPTVLVLNAVSVEPPFVDQDAARTAVGFDGDGSLVVCLGRLVEQKGQDVLLDAWPQVRASESAARLALVGGGPLESELRKQATDDVIFVGEVDREVAIAWVQAADVVAAPSRWETMSLAVLEALALGRPVVAADAQGMKDAISGGAGQIVAIDDAQELARALIPYVADKNFAAAEGVRSAQNYEAKWAAQMQRNGDQLDTSYRGLIGH